MNHFNSLLY